MVGWLNTLMDGWMDGRRSNVYIGSKSTSSHSCVRRNGRTDECMDGQTENTDVLTDGRTYGRTTDRRIDR